MKNKLVILFLLVHTVLLSQDMLRIRFYTKTSLNEEKAISGMKVYLTKHEKSKPQPFDPGTTNEKGEVTFTLFDLKKGRDDSYQISANYSDYEPFVETKPLNKNSALTFSIEMRKRASLIPNKKFDLSGSVFDPYGSVDSLISEYVEIIPKRSDTRDGPSKKVKINSSGMFEATIEDENPRYISFRYLITTKKYKLDSTIKVPSDEGTRFIHDLTVLFKNQNDIDYTRFYKEYKKSVESLKPLTDTLRLLKRGNDSLKHSIDSLKHSIDSFKLIIPKLEKRNKLLNKLWQPAIPIVFSGIAYGISQKFCSDYKNQPNNLELYKKANDWNHAAIATFWSGITVGGVFGIQELYYFFKTKKPKK
jgi:hypothetical protein